MFEIGSTIHLLLCLPIPILYWIFQKQKGNKKLLLVCSLLLFGMEIWKQAYYCLNHGWTVWIFPFQLCSIPIYYFLFFRTKMEEAFESFLSTYILLASVFALFYPADMIHQEIALTIHSFLWHYILICMAAISKDTSFPKGTLVFLISAMLATGINILLTPFGEINLFYIHPFIPSTQPVFMEIGNQFGILVKNTIYMTAIIIGSGLIHIVTKQRK